MFEAFKLDKRVVDRAMRKEMLENAEGPSVQAEEDEFGDWDWGFEDC